MKKSSLWIDGAECAARSGDCFEGRSPFEGCVLGHYADGDAEDAEEAILAARRAFDTGVWGQSVARTRYTVLDGVPSC